MSSDATFVDENFFSEDRARTSQQPPRRTPTSKLPKRTKKHKAPHPHHHSVGELIRHDKEGHLSKNDFNTHMDNHIQTLKQEFINDLTGGLKKSLSRFIVGEDTTHMFDDIVQHKFAKLAQASYEHYNDRSATEYLRGSEHDYVPELKDFEIDPLSTKDDLVLHNPKTGEVVISFRGTQEKEAVKDWWVNSRIAMGAEGGQQTQRYKNAQKLMDKVIYKHSKQNLSVTGHSQGGGLSSHFGAEFDVPSHSFDPAVSLKQIVDHGSGKYLMNTSKHTMYRPTGDVVSINTHAPNIQNAFNVKNINSTQELGSTMLDLHDLNMFHPKPLEVTGTSVKVVRNTNLASLKGAVKGGVDLGGKVLTAYDTISDISRDLEQGNEVNAVLDTGKNVGAFYGADLAFAGASGATELGLATLGASSALLPVAVGFMSAVAATAAIEYAFSELENTAFIKQANEDVSDALETAAEGWSNLEDTITGVDDFQEKAADYDIYDLGDDIKDGWNSFTSWAGW